MLEIRWQTELDPGAAHARAQWLVRPLLTVGLALGLLFPIVALFGIQRIEERYTVSPNTSAAMPSLEKLLEASPIGTQLNRAEQTADGFVVEYRAIGARWLQRLLEGPLDVPDTRLLLFRSTLDPVASLPAFILLLVLSWWLAGPLARRSVRVEPA